MPEVNDSTSVEYREVPGYPAYRVGSDGSIWSINGYRIKDRGVWRKLRPTKMCGYLIFFPCRHKYLKVHRVVLGAFVGPCPPGMVACHNDDNRLNNHLANLRWDTQKANMEDMARRYKALGWERRFRAKASKDQAIRIREEYQKGISVAKISRSIGLSYKVVYRIATGETWRELA